MASSSVGPASLFLGLALLLSLLGSGVARSFAPVEPTCKFLTMSKNVDALPNRNDSRSAPAGTHLIHTSKTVGVVEVGDGGLLTVRRQATESTHNTEIEEIWGPLPNTVAAAGHEAAVHMTELQLPTPAAGSGARTLVVSFESRSGNSLSLQLSLHTAHADALNVSLALPASPALVRHAFNTSLPRDVSEFMSFRFTNEDNFSISNIIVEVDTCAAQPNDCSASPCLNGGLCSFLDGKRVCACPPTATGELCADLITTIARADTPLRRDRRFCPTGYYHSAKKGSWWSGYTYHCSSCPPGYRCLHNIAYPCYAGYYQGSYGRTSCPSCPAGKYSNAAYSTYCHSCYGGKYSPQSASGCSACPAGTYSGWAYGSCPSCPGGKISSYAKSYCTACNYGQYKGSASACYNCPSRKYTSTSSNGYTGCYNCPAGSYCPGGKVSYGCPAGKYSPYYSYTCYNCPRDKISGSYAGSCRNCPSGQYTNRQVGRPTCSSYCNACAYGGKCTQTSYGYNCRCPLGRYGSKCHSTYNSCHSFSCAPYSGTVTSCSGASRHCSLAHGTRRSDLVMFENFDGLSALLQPDVKYSWWANVWTPTPPEGLTVDLGSTGAVNKGHPFSGWTFGYATWWNSRDSLSVGFPYEGTHGHNIIAVADSRLLTQYNYWAWGPIYAILETQAITIPSNTNQVRIWFDTKFHGNYWQCGYFEVSTNGHAFGTLGYFTGPSAYRNYAKTVTVPVGTTRVWFRWRVHNAQSSFLWGIDNIKVVADQRALCHSGWYGDVCEHNINDCAGNPCRNGGTCRDGINSYVCYCRTGFRGANCAENINDCRSDTCSYHGQCSDGINSFTCACHYGYSGTRCTTRNECLPNPCHNGATCHDDHNKARCVYAHGTCYVNTAGTQLSCSCHAGWTGARCNTNINECAPGPCKNSGTCTDLINGFTCACRPGWAGHTCTTNVNECAPRPCENGGTCRDGINSYTCSCPPSHYGTTCQIKEPCVPSPCHASATLCERNAAGLAKCVYTNGDCIIQANGSPQCSCDTGFTGTDCATNIDDCASNPCLNGATCHDGIMSFACVCLPQFAGITCACPRGMSGDKCDVSCVTAPVTSVVNTYSSSATNQVMRVSPTLDATVTFTHAKALTSGQTVTLVLHGKTSWTREPPVVLVLRGTTVACRMTYTHGRMACSSPLFRAGGSFIVRLAADVDPALVEIYDDSASWHFLRPVLEVEHHLEDQMDCPWDACTWSSWDMSACSMQACAASPVKSRWPVAKQAHTSPADTISCLLAKQSAPCYAGSCSSTTCSWSPWDPWGACSVACGGNGGFEMRVRQPQSSSALWCPGAATETRSCGNTACHPSDCAWSVWSSWSSVCTVSCGGGVHRRHRHVLSHARHGGQECAGDAAETRPCNTQGCPIDCVFSQWTDWSPCTASCGNAGETVRTRAPLNAHMYGGKPCTGSKQETVACNRIACPIDCVWTTWTAYDTCSVASCGGGTQKRSRTQSPAAAHGGRPCTGSATNSRACNEKPCTTPFDCVWSSWSDWECGAACNEAGTSTRTRTIVSPTQPGGLDCTGGNSETGTCQGDPCPVDCTLADWTTWSACSELCGGGSKQRQRGEAQSAAYGGAACSSTLARSESMVCNSVDCKHVLCSWEQWSAWGACSKTCDGGSQTRERKLITSSHTFVCETLDRETRSCGTGVCINTIACAKAVPDSDADRRCKGVVGGELFMELGAGVAALGVVNQVVESVEAQSALVSFLNSLLTVTYGDQRPQDILFTAITTPQPDSVVIYAQTQLSGRVLVKFVAEMLGMPLLTMVPFPDLSVFPTVEKFFSSMRPGPTAHPFTHHSTATAPANRRRDEFLKNSIDYSAMGVQDGTFGAGFLSMISPKAPVQELQLNNLFDLSVSGKVGKDGSCAALYWYLSLMGKFKLQRTATAMDNCPWTIAALIRYATGSKDIVGDEGFVPIPLATMGFKSFTIVLNNGRTNLALFGGGLSGGVGSRGRRDLHRASIFELEAEYYRTRDNTDVHEMQPRDAAQRGQSFVAWLLREREKLEAEHARVCGPMNPCSNNGTCHLHDTDEGIFVCECPLGFHGSRCASTIDHCASLPCTHNGTCDANADGFVCECPPAFAGDVCELLADTCASSPCANKGACFHSLWSPTGFVCECTSPWAGLFCDHVEPAVLAAAYTSGTEVALQTHANHMSRRALGDADSIKNFFTTFWKPSTFTIDLEFAFATRSDVTFEDSDGVLRLAYQGYMGCDIVIGWNNVGNLKASGRDLCTKSTAARTFFGGEYEYSPAVPFHFQFTASISFLFAGLQFALGIGREFIDDVNQIDQCEWYKAQRGITRRDIVDASAVRPLVLAHDLRLTRETIVAMDKDTFQVFQNLVCDSRNPFITCFDGTRDSAKRLAEDLPADALEREDLRLGRVRRNPDTGELEETGYEPDENVRVDESNDVTESEMLYDMDDDDIFDTDMDVDSNGLALSRGTRATDCNPGKQHDAGGSCVPCGAGKYNDVVNGACKRCPSGKRGKTGIRDGCDPCATGRFSSQAGLQTCVECTEGKYADVTGSKSCKSCSAGKMLNAKGATAASDCTPCGKGTYSSSGSSVCTQCRGGRFSDATSATGSSTCKACTSGRYSSTMGASECANECSKGKFSTSTGAKASTACKPCSAGKFSNLEGGSVCTPCTAGTHTATSGLSECANCAAGKISKATGQSVCSDCAAGHYQDGEGTSVCKKCAAGKAVAAKGSVAAASCVMCDFGFYSSSEGATECKVCAPEKYSAADRKTCKTCPAGKIRDENAPGDEKCSECGTNSYTPSPGEQCAECAPNKIAKADGTGCNACPSGHHRPKRGEVCLACPLGTFSKDDSKGCQTCPSGKYSDAAGATQCTDCAIGRFSSASSLTVCTACDEGKVATKTGLTTCSSCPSSKYTTNGQTCIECASPKKVVDGRCVDCSGNQFMDASLAPPACAACPANQVPAADGQSCEACDATSGKVKKDNRCVQCKANEKIVGTDCTPCPAGEKRSSADATICAVGCDNDLVAKTKSDGSVVCELVSKACKANERVVDNKCTACVAPLKMRKKDDPQTCTADGAEACPDGQDMAKDGSRCVTDPKLSKFAVQGDMRWFGYVEFPSMSIRSMAAAFGHNAEFVGRDAKCYGDFDGGNLIGCTCDWEHPNQVMREQTELGALCTVGHYANEGVCTKCKSPKVPDADRLKCIECDAKAGEFPAGDSSGCITCVRPQYRKAIACKTCSVAEGALNAAGTACEACVVPLKRAADGSACVRCPAGQALVSGKCTECTGTTAVNAAGTACVTCPSATTERLADGCKQKTATVSNCLEGDDKTCTRCQPGHKLESGKCLACPGDLVVSADGKKCISCPSGMKAAEDHQRCLIKECAADAGNARTADGECVACTGDKAVQGDKCVKCASPMFPLADHSACDRCPNGKYRDTTLQACLSCASGMAVNVAGTGCMSCTGKTKVAKDQRGCESNTGECDLPQCSRCSLDGTTCEMCMTGAILNTPKTACTPCKKGEAVNSDRTACVACPAGTIVSRGGDQCLPIKCTEGFFLSRVQGQCLTCDTRALNSYYDGCFDFECSAIGGSTVHASKVGCTCTGAAGEVIPDHFYCDTSKKQLLDCPRSMPASLDKTDFPPKCFKDAAKLCPNGSILKGRSCEKCGSGKTNNADKTACITTPTSRRGVGDDEAEAGALVRRADADIADGDTIKSKCSCIQHGRCRRFDVRLDATFQCIRCPSGSASNGHSCKYCPAGQYLTIDGLCRACTTLEKLESGWCVPHKGSVAPGIKPNYCVDPFRGYTAGRWAESKFLNGFLRILGSITFIAPTIKVYPGFGKSYTLVSLSVTVEWLSFTCPLELRLFQKDPNTRVGRRRGAGSTALDMFKSMAMTVEVSLKQIAKLIGVVTSAISGEDVTSIINKFVPRDVDIRIAFTYSGDEKDLLLNPNVRPKFDAYKYAKRIPKGFSVLLSISLPPLSSPDCGDICHFIKENLGDVFIMMYLGINPGDPTAGESPIVEFGASIGGFVLSRDDNNCPEVILEELGFFAVVSPDPTKVKLGFSAGLSLDIGRLIDGPPASGSCAPVNNLIFSLTISISTTQFTLDARMIGIWPNAFGLKHFFFGNARLMIGISPSSPVGLSAFGLAADVRYGAAGCSERVSGITKLVEKTGCIGGSLDFQVSTAEPLNNYFFGALYGMTLKEVFAATMSPDTFKDVCGVMPDDVLTSGFPRPPAGQDQGNPRLSFTTNPAGHQTPTRRIPFGFQFYGHVKILSIEAGADVVIMPPPSDPAVFKVKFWLKNAFDLGGIVALQRSCADNVNGPYFFANVVLSMSALAEGKSPIKELGVNISAAGSFLGMCTEIIVSMDMVRTRIEINDMPFLFVLSAFIDIEADYGSVADSRFMVNITVNDSRLRKILTSIRTELKSASEAFNKAMDQANDDCDQFFDDVGAAFEEAGKAIAEFATAAVQAIGAAFEAAAAAVVKFVTALVDGFKKAGTALIKGIEDFMRTGDFSKLGEAIGEAFKQVLAGVFKAFGAECPSYGPTCQAEMGKLNEKLKKYRDDTSKRVKQLDHYSARYMDEVKLGLAKVKEVSVATGATNGACDEVCQLKKLDEASEYVTAAAMHVRDFDAAREGISTSIRVHRGELRAQLPKSRRRSGDNSMLERIEEALSSTAILTRDIVVDRERKWAALADAVTDVVHDVMDCDESWDAEKAVCDEAMVRSSIGVVSDLIEYMDVNVTMTALGNGTRPSPHRILGDRVSYWRTLVRQAMYNKNPARVKQAQFADAREREQVPNRVTTRGAACVPFVFEAHHFTGCTTLGRGFEWCATSVMKQTGLVREWGECLSAFEYSELMLVALNNEPLQEVWFYKSLDAAAYANAASGITLSQATASDGSAATSWTPKAHKKGTLFVEVLHGRGMGSSADAYVRLLVDGTEVFVSTTKTDSATPAWNEKYQASSVSPGSVLTVEVWECDLASNCDNHQTTTGAMYGYTTVALKAVTSGIQGTVAVYRNAGHGSVDFVWGLTVSSTDYVPYPATGYTDAVRVSLANPLMMQAFAVKASASSRWKLLGRVASKCSVRPRWHVLHDDSDPLANRVPLGMVEPKLGDAPVVPMRAPEHPALNYVDAMRITVLRSQNGSSHTVVTEDVAHILELEFLRGDQPAGVQIHSVLGTNMTAIGSGDCKSALTDGKATSACEFATLTVRFAATTRVTGLRIHSTSSRPLTFTIEGQNDWTCGWNPMVSAEGSEDPTDDFTWTVREVNGDKVSVLAAVADGLRDAAWSGETATATLAGDNSALVMFELTPAVGRADRLVDAILTVQGGSTTVEVLSLDAQQAYEDWRTAEATKSGPAEASKGTVACSLDAKGACNLKSVVNAALVAKKRFLTVRLRSTGVASNTVKMREGGSATAPQLTLTLSTGQLGTRGFVEGGFEYLKAVASSTTHNQRVLSGSDVPNLFDRGITLMAWVRLLANEGTCSGTGVRTVLAASPAWQAMNTAVKEADTSPLVRANAAKTQNCEQTSFAVGAVALAVTCDGRVVVQMRQRYCEQLVKTLSSERTVVLRVPSQEGKLSWQHVAVVVRAEAATVEFFVDGVSSGEVVYDFSDSLTAIKLAATPARMYTTAALLYANPLSASLVAGRMVSTTPSTVGRIGGVCRASANVPLTYCPVGSTCTGEGYGKGQGRSDLLDERICAQVCPTNGDTRDERGYCKYGAGNAPNGHHCKLDVHCASQHCDVPHGKTDGKCAVNYGNTGCNSAIPCRGQSQSRATCVAGRCIEKCFIPAYESTKAQGKCMFQGSKDVLRGFPCASPFDCAPGATCKAVKLCNSDPSKELRCVEECVSPSIGYMHARAGVHLDARVASFAPSGCAGDTLHTGKCVYRGDSDVPAGMGCTYAAQCQTKATFVTLCKANVCVHECEHTGATVVGDKCSYVGAGDIPAGHACATAGQCLPLKGGGADCVNGVCVQSCRLPSIPVLASGACEFTGMGDLPHGAVCAEDTNCKARPEVNGKARCWLGLCEMLCPYSLKATPLGTACEYEGLEDVPLGMQCVEMHHCKSTVCQDRTCVEKCVWDDIPHQADGTCKYKGESDLPVGLTCQYDSECAAPRKGDASCIAGACAHQCRLQVPLLVVDRVPQCQYSGNADLPVGHECTADSQCQRRGGGSAACVAGVCEQTCYMANTPLNSLGECLYSGEWDVPPFGPCNVTRNCRQEISNAVFVCVANQCREQCLFDDIPVHPETGRCTLQGHADLPAGSSCNKDSQCVPRVRGIAKCTRGTCTPACAHPSIKLRKDGSCDYLGVSDIPAGDGCYTSSQCRPATRGTAECVANVCVLACFETFLQLDSAGVCPFSARGDLPIGSQCNPAELGQCLKGTRGADETLVDRCVPNSVGAHDVCAPPPQYAMKSQVYAAAVEYDAGVQSRWTLTSRGEAFVPRSVELENTVWQATSATSIVMQFVKPTTMPPAADTRFVLFVTCVDCAPDQIVGEALGNAPLLDASTTTVGAAWSWYESAVELRHTTPTPSIRCEEAGYTTSDRQFVQLQCTATAVVAASSKAGLVTLALWSTRGSVTLYGMASPDPSDMPMLYGGSVASASSEFPDMLQGSHLAAVTRRDAEMDDEVWENDMEFDNGRDEEESTGHFQAAPKRRVALPGTPAVDAWEAEWAREADLAEQRYQEVAAMQRPEEMNDEVEEEEEEMMWTNEMLSEHRRRSAENGRGNALHAPVMPPSFEEEDRQLLAHMATLTESDRALVAAHDDEKWLLEDGEWKYECASPNDPRNRTIDGRCWWAKGEVPAGIACLQDRDCASGSCVWADRMWDATGRCAKGVGTHEEVEVWRRGTFEYGTSVFDDDDKVVSSYVDVDDHAYIPRTQMALHREARFFLCDAAVGLARGVVNLGFMAIDGLISLFMKAFQLNNLNVFLELFPGKLQGTLSVALDAVVFGIPLKFDLTIDLGSLAKTIVNLLIRLGRSICDGLEMGDICNGIIESL